MIMEKVSAKNLRALTFFEDSLFNSKSIAQQINDWTDEHPNAEVVDIQLVAYRDYEKALMLYENKD